MHRDETLGFEDPQAPLGLQPRTRETYEVLAAASGASTRELITRLGQSSMRAALIYQHATSERDREIAAGMDKRIAKATKKNRKRKPS